LGNVIDPYQEIEWLKSFGISEETAIDYFRYFLMREVPFGNDGNYSRESLINRINAELSNNVGNLTQRVLTFIYKNCDGKIPENKIPKNDAEDYAQDEVLKNLIFAVKNITDDLYRLTLVPNDIMAFGYLSNERLHSKAPWNLKKEGKIDEMNSILNLTVEKIRKIAILFLPFIPSSANQILDLLNIDQSERNFASLNNPLKPGHKINEPKIIFPQLKEIKI